MSGVDRKIIGFHQDDEGHWVADLECGHTQHVRHNPPWINRPWTTTAEGRATVLGKYLSCKQCESYKLNSGDIATFWRDGAHFESRIHSAWFSD